MSALLAVGVIVAVVVVLAVWMYRRSAKLGLSALQINADGSLLLGVSSIGDPSKQLLGKRLVISTKALGRIYTSICSAAVAPWAGTGGSGTGASLIAAIVTPKGTYSGPLLPPVGSPVIVGLDANDYAIVTPMW
jgi:hypothetical protein